MRELVARAAMIGVRLKDRKETIAVAESSAGGLISAALLAVPGASAYFLGAGVVYTQAARRGLLQVPDAAVMGVRSSTEAYALVKAQAVRERVGATWGLAETGASGPAGNRYGDAPGHACLAIAGPVERAITLETGHGDRERNMRTFARAALDLLAEALGAPPMDSFPGIVPGLRGERRAVVTPAWATTHAGGQGALMAIWMILEMELAAQEATQPRLPADHTTVGYEICVRHLRPTPVGESFTATAELLEVDGRKLFFTVEACNARERIGEGTLRRTIVRRGQLG